MSATSSVHENEFVAVFVLPDRRDRLAFELKKDRGSFLGRFCHNVTAVLDVRYLTRIDPKSGSSEKVIDLLQKLGAPATCYVLSHDDQVDGHVLPLKQAVAKVYGHGLPSIISCIPGELAYVETEQEVGPPARFILQRRKSPTSR